jgi:hypothetical protein
VYGAYGGCVAMHDARARVRWSGSAHRPSHVDHSSGVISHRDRGVPSCALENPFCGHTVPGAVRTERWWAVANGVGHRGGTTGCRGGCLPSDAAHSNESNHPQDDRIVKVCHAHVATVLSPSPHSPNHACGHRFARGCHQLPPHPSLAHPQW